MRAEELEDADALEWFARFDSPIVDKSRSGRPRSSGRSQAWAPRASPVQAAFVSAGTFASGAAMPVLTVLMATDRMRIPVVATMSLMFLALSVTRWTASPDESCTAVVLAVVRRFATPDRVLLGPQSQTPHESRQPLLPQVRRGD